MNLPHHVHICQRPFKLPVPTPTEVINIEAYLNFDNVVILGIDLSVDGNKLMSLSSSHLAWMSAGSIKVTPVALPPQMQW